MSVISALASIWYELDSILLQAIIKLESCHSEILFVRIFASQKKLKEVKTLASENVNMTDLLPVIKIDLGLWLIWPWKLYKICSLMIKKMTFVEFVENWALN